MRVVGDYELLEQLGRGSSGVVWRAKPATGGPHVALKVLYDSVAHDGPTVQRFLASGRLLLNNPIGGAVQVLDVVDADGVAAIAMELVDAPSLRELMKAGALEPAQAAMIAAQVASTLGRAHAEGIIHRDVKPENILVRRDDATGQVRALLSDFGIASSLEGRSTLTTTQPGTSAYTSPETFKNAPPAPSRDVYALGIVLYEMCAGKRPFISTNPAALMREHLEAQPSRPAQMPVSLWQWVEASLAKQPHERPDATRLGSELAALWPKLVDPSEPDALPDEVATVARLPLHISEETTWTTSESPRRRGAWVVGVAAALASAIGVGYAVTQTPNETQAEQSAVAAATSGPTPTAKHPTPETPSAPPTSAPTTSLASATTGSPIPSRSKPARLRAEPPASECEPLHPPARVNPAPAQPAEAPVKPKPAEAAQAPTKRKPTEPVKEKESGPKCPGADCHGASPSSFNGACLKDGYRVDSASGRLGPSGDLPAQLELFHSPKCKTSWVVATVTADPNSLGYTVVLNTTAGRTLTGALTKASRYTTRMIDLPQGDCVDANLFFSYQGRGRNPIELSTRFCKTQS